VLERLTAERGAPANIRSDNGPELTATVLREWCRRGSTAAAYIEPGPPWQNAYVESFDARLRDELLNVEVFTSLAEAKVLAADWHQDYNANHPHSALGMMSPGRFAASLREAAIRSDTHCIPTLGPHSGWTDEWGPVMLAALTVVGLAAGSIALPWEGRTIGHRARARARIGNPAEGVGPALMRPHAEECGWSQYRTDSAFHNTCWISSWPRSDVGPTFLAPQGFMTTASDRHRAQAVSRREEELADGFAEMRFTVSAESAEALERANGGIEHAGQLARLEFQRMYGEQELRSRTPCHSAGG
jgi:Integrase core domain